VKRKLHAINLNRPDFERQLADDRAAFEDRVLALETKLLATILRLNKGAIKIANGHEGEQQTEN
jgi:hypothetical protein